MKILVFCAKGFETMEFSAFNVPVIVDKTIDEINVNEYDALAIPGGFR